MENINQATSAQLIDTTTSSLATATTTNPELPGADNLKLGSTTSSGSHLEQQQSLVKQKEAELKEMQNQIESYNQMVTQLFSQREMAVKRLSDMDIQIQELNRLLEAERISVEAKDRELKSKRTKLQALKSEEDELTSKLKSTKQELSVTTDNLSNIQTNEAQIQAKLAELKQFLATTNSTLDDIEKAITYKDTIKLSALCDQPLKPPSPLTTNTLLTNGVKIQDSISAGMTTIQDPFGQDQNVDPFADNDPFASEDNLFGFDGHERPFQIPEDDPFAPPPQGGGGGNSSGF
uniref:Epidermal growth factor receptor substrate 15-like 1 n=1 Tax=Aceria tosichella TaxID=561515 RepID=A0A6G1S9J1_9ACAR